MRDYQLYLKDILSAMDSIEAFVEGMSFEEFRADDKTASVVLSENLKSLGRQQKIFRMKFDSSIQLFPGKKWQE